MQRYRLIPKSSIKPHTPFVWLDQADNYKEMKLAVGERVFGHEDAKRALKWIFVYNPRTKGYRIHESTGKQIFILVPDLPRTWRIHYKYEGLRGVWDWESQPFISFPRAVREVANLLARAEETGTWFHLRLIHTNTVTGEEITYVEVESAGLKPCEED